MAGLAHRCIKRFIARTASKARFIGVMPTRWLAVVSPTSASFVVSLSVVLAAGAGCAAHAAEVKPLASREAKQVFGEIELPSSAPQRSIGKYDRGCIAGAKPLPITGQSWQAMRLSRNRIWGHSSLVKYIEKLARDSKKLDGWPGLLVGDMGQPMGGPMLSGHASHQLGLDADLWFKPMPDRVLTPTEREEAAADSVVDETALTVDKTLWTEAQAKLLKRAASYSEVARIFVHPAIKKALCNFAGKDRTWLQKIRPWWKHNDHFHVRLNCPSGDSVCVAQPPTGTEDGCGKELDDWIKRLRVPPAPAPKPSPPPKPVLMSDMPKECQDMAAAQEKLIAAKAAP